VKSIGITAFREASLSTPVIRRYVRLFMTPPPVNETNSEALSLQKMLGMVVVRHWKLYGHQIEAIIPVTGANQSSLTGLIHRLKREEDGTEKCGLYCRILKTMCDSKLEDLQNQVSPENLLRGYDETLEENLQKMAVSLQVLYGKQCLMEDDFPSVDAGSETKIYDSRSSIQRLRFYNRVKFRVENFAAHLIQDKFRLRGFNSKLGSIARATTDVAQLLSRGTNKTTPREHMEEMPEYHELEVAAVESEEPDVIK